VLQIGRSEQLTMAAGTDDRGRLLRNPNHAFDAAHDATDHTAHHGTGHGADRTGRMLPHGSALLASTNNALGLGLERHAKSGNNNHTNCERHLHEQSPPLEICSFDDRRVDLVRAIWRQREANVAAYQQNRSGILRHATAGRSRPGLFRFGGRAVRQQLCRMGSRSFRRPRAWQWLRLSKRTGLDRPAAVSHGPTAAVLDLKKPTQRLLDGKEELKLIIKNPRSPGFVYGL
jgi:hypothetical protein